MGCRNQTTSQGLEWTLGTGFSTRINQLISLQKCGDVACVQNWFTKTGLSYSDILVETSGLAQSLIDSLSEDKSYKFVYQNAKYLVYQPSRWLKETKESLAATVCSRLSI